MSKRRYENIILNGEHFILDTKETTTTPTQFTVRGIHDVYGRCSARKEAIWLDWSNWFYNNDGICTVSSHNCNFFTITGYVKDKETGERYFCYITASNNRCLKVVD